MPSVPVTYPTSQFSALDELMWHMENPELMSNRRACVQHCGTRDEMRWGVIKSGAWKYSIGARMRRCPVVHI